MRNVWERNEIDSENNIQSAYQVPKAPEQMWMPRAVQRQQLRTGCSDLCAVSVYHLSAFFAARCSATHRLCNVPAVRASTVAAICKLTWLVLGEDPAARSHRVEQFTAL